MKSLDGDFDEKNGFSTKRSNIQSKDLKEANEKIRLLETKERDYKIII